MNKQELAEQILKKHWDEAYNTPRQDYYIGAHEQLGKTYKAIIAAIVEAMDAPAKEGMTDESLSALEAINHVCGTLDFSSYNQMKEAIIEAVELSEKALAAKEAISVPAQQGVDTASVGNSIEQMNAALPSVFKLLSEMGYEQTAITLIDAWNKIRSQPILLSSEKVKQLIDYIYDFGWHYGRFYHVGDGDKIKSAIQERFQLPEEAIQSLLNSDVLAAQPLQPSLEEKKEDLVASSSATSSVPCVTPLYNNNSIQQ